MVLGIPINAEHAIQIHISGSLKGEIPVENVSGMFVSISYYILFLLVAWCNRDHANDQK